MKATIANHYEGLSTDDLVRVTGERGVWRFKFAMTFPDRPAEIRVHGGPSGNTAYRTFMAERIKPATRRQKQLHNREEA